MVFSSIPFLFFFLPICLIIYYLVPFKYKNYVLLIFSLIFYAWGEPIYVFLMIFSTLVDYINGRLYSKNKTKKKTYFIVAILINLSLLLFFKYADFLINIFNYLLKTNIPLLHIGLPIGISFYTFQTMSYSIDVYKGEVKPDTNYFRYLTYVSMFPQLIAGPIVRYKDINKELHKRTINFNKISNGFIRFLNGLFKKVLIANNIGSLFNIIVKSNLAATSVLTLWLGALAFTFQIYFDFSGYSDMAIGLGKMLGFDFLENFNYPYISKSITDFWRRWHISLSSFFRDYVYIPLKGSRCSKIINIRNIMVVWLLTGLWHGANVNFVLWGLYYGILLILEKFVFKNILDKLPNIVKHIYTMFLVVVGWVIFSIDNTSILGTYLKGMFGLNKLSFIDNNFRFYFSNYLIIFIISIIFSLPLKEKNTKLFNIIKVIIYIILFVVTLAFLVSDSYNPFLYFKF